MIETAEEFRTLRVSSNPEKYNRAAHEEAPIEVWFDVIERMPEMRQWVAHNKTVPVEILAKLVDDPNEKVRYMVAMKRKLPEELQLRLTEDPSPSVRVRLAQNPKVTPRVLEILANDVNEWVKQEVAEVREAS